METVSNSVELFMPILQLFTIYQLMQRRTRCDYNLKLMFGSKKYFAFQPIRTTALIFVVTDGIFLSLCYYHFTLISTANTTIILICINIFRKEPQN